MEDERKRNQKLYEREMQKVVEPFEREMTHTKAQRAMDQVERMKSDTERYPNMQNEDFQGTMASMLSVDPGTGQMTPRAMNLDDAYDLATVQWSRDDRELPLAPSRKAEAKKDAELLEDQGGPSGEEEPGEPPPKFKDAREAAEHSMKKLGWR